MPTKLMNLQKGKTFSINFLFRNCCDEFVVRRHFCAYCVNIVLLSIAEIVEGLLV